MGIFVERCVTLCSDDIFSIDEAWLSKSASLEQDTSLPLAQTLQDRERDGAALAETRGQVSGDGDSPLPLSEQGPEARRSLGPPGLHAIARRRRPAKRGDTSLGLWQQSLAPARNAFAVKLRECTSASFAC